MPVIEFRKQHKAVSRFDFLDDEDGMVNTVLLRVETEDVFSLGDICALYLCDFNGIQALVKIPQHSADSDLVKNEATVLQEICPDGNWHEKFYRYLPQLLYTDVHDDVTINVFPYYEDWLTLAEVIMAYPEGIDFKDAAWMYKRLLIALGFAHERGFVFGAAIPDHVLIHPENHGGKIIDWSYAEKIQGKDTKHLRAISNHNRAYYPPEVFRKGPVHPTLDIYMATKVMVALLGGDITTNEMPDAVPTEVQAILKTALVEDFKRRPQNAWDFHKAFEDVLKRVVGPRKFRPFRMP